MVSRSSWIRALSMMVLLRCDFDYRHIQCFSLPKNIFDSLRGSRPPSLVVPPRVVLLYVCVFLGSPALHGRPFCRQGIWISFVLREFALCYERHLESMRTVPWLRPAHRIGPVRARAVRGAQAGSTRNPKPFGLIRCARNARTELVWCARGLCAEPKRVRPGIQNPQ